MKRYFMVRDEHMPTIKERMPGMDFIDLVTHGPAGDKWNLVCLCEDATLPKPEWIAFPPLTDATTTLRQSKVPEECLADLGLTGDETIVQAVEVFIAVNPIM